MKFRIKLLAVFILLLFYKSLLAQNPDTVSFLHISDIHLVYNPGIFQKNLQENRSRYNNGVIPFQIFLEKVPAETDADFIIATGDLVDAFEAELENGEMFGFQIEQFNRSISAIIIPVFLTLGNHDLTAYSWGDSTRISTQNVAEKARASWIKNVPCFQNGTYYSRTVKVGKTEYRLIFLDNGYNMVRENEKVSIPYISREQQYWLEDQFNESDKDVEILLMHIPMNVDKIGSAENEGIYSLFDKQRSMKLVLVGHNHRNEIKEYSSGNNHFYQIQTAAFATDREAWRLIRLTEDKIFVSYPGKRENEQIIMLKEND